MKNLIRVCLLLALASCADGHEKAAAELASRILPVQCRNITFNHVQSDTNCYTMSASDGKLVINADCSGTMAKALRDYLADYCNIAVTPYLRDTVIEPAVLPATDGTVSRKAIAPYRFFFNYCTFAYTVGYWNWEEWERLIDYLAMNGVNMVLAHTGHESVWQNVYRRFGLSDEEILAYFTGPSTLPFNRMANIEGWNGPLPQSWLDGQQELQKKIIAREKSLGISPILSSFTGHVPRALKEHYPDADITEMGWMGFKDYSTWYLNPNDTLYAKILAAFHEEQEKMYGRPSHLYCVDLFNELNPPSWEADYLASVSDRTYRALADADPDAVWVQMSWMFLNANWTEERIKAYLDAVPRHKLLMLDYAGDFWELYNGKTDQYAGQDFLWCYLGNFGGHTVLGGNLPDVGRRIDTVFNVAPSCKGIGCTLEGFGANMEMCEYSLDRAWEKQYDDKTWLEKLADRRFGSVNGHYRNAWVQLRTELLNRREDDYWAEITVMPDINRDSRVMALKDIGKMRDIWGELLEAGNSSAPLHRFDCVNFGRNYLDALFGCQAKELSAAYKRHDKAKVKELCDSMTGILDDVDRLLGADAYFLLGRWVEQAGRWGEDEALKKYYRQDARNIVSTWGYKGCSLIDYACRDYNGLVGTYYKPRWTKFMEMISGPEPFDGDAYYRWCREFEWNWVVSDSPYPAEPVGDAYEISLELYRKYSKIK